MKTHKKVTGHFWGTFLLTTTFLMSYIPRYALGDNLELLPNEISISQSSMFGRAVGLNNVHNPQESNILSSPTYLRFSFLPDRLSDDINFRERQLLIFPVQEYQSYFQGKARKEFDARVNRLKQLISTGYAGIETMIPVFPPSNTQQLFRSQIQYIKFANGMGVRFISSYAKDDSPVKNEDLFYTFQGLTKDSGYLVCFFHPVSVRNLPVTEDHSFAGLYLDHLDPESFSPKLAKLDSLVQSIEIRPDMAFKVPLKQLKNMSYKKTSFGTEPIALRNGKYESKKEHKEINLLNLRAMGDVDGDGTIETAVLLVTNTQGSGTFYDLAIVKSVGGKRKNVATQLLGDRIQIKSIRMERNLIVLDLITHKSEDALCCPTQRTTKSFELKGSELIPVETP